MSSVMVVDDDAAVRTLMTRWLQSGGFDVSAASSAAQAVEVARQCPQDVAVCDVHMPGHDGIWLVERLKSQHPATAVVMATGVDELETAIRTLRLGVQDYLVKPVTCQSLTEAVGRGIQWHERAVDERAQRQRLEAEVQRRQHQLAATIADLHLTSSAAVDALLRMLTLHDPLAYTHAKRVATLARRLATALTGDASAVMHIEFGALLHDIGKIAVGVRVLGKPEALSAGERELIRMHPQIGADIVTHAPFLREAAPTVLASHERWDGLGYPRGLSGSDIPLGARIVAVADTYDALTQDRPYRLARTSSEALAEIQRNRGSQFDPAVVDVLTRLLEDRLPA